MACRNNPLTHVSKSLLSQISFRRRLYMTHNLSYDSQRSKFYFPPCLEQFLRELPTARRDSYILSNASVDHHLGLEFFQSPSYFLQLTSYNGRISYDSQVFLQKHASVPKCNLTISNFRYITISPPLGHFFSSKTQARINIVEERK